MYSPPRDSVHLLDMQECLNEEKEPEPDAALLRWAEWIKTRKAIFQNLSSKTGQEPKCLAENVNKTYRQMLDQKLVEEAGKYMTPDKYRGHPDWYKTVQPKSNCLKKKCISELVYPADVKFTEDPDVVRNKCYFGVPKAIQAEQGIIGYCSEKEKDRVWQKNVYLASRKEELRENWEVLETFRPDIDSLYVKELWRFSTTPRVGTRPILFILEGIARQVQQPSESSWSGIESMIQKRVRDAAIADVLDEMVRGVYTPKSHAPYADMFGASELFEFNNPKLYYR
ncbi:unnamed protein product [Nesidiocoris tenuis]|uniref:Uncharacterized protein n=1 Tax=Nesidiocoris tenuis TaxID=355587 RepID=A0A6H5HAW0_9HEMI|nr:unnamed protein product [Nesidiocoris tenuis]